MELLRSDVVIRTMFYHGTPFYANSVRVAGRVSTRDRPPGHPAPALAAASARPRAAAAARPDHPRGDRAEGARAAPPRRPRPAQHTPRLRGAQHRRGVAL